MPRIDRTAKFELKDRILDTIARMLTGNSICVALLKHGIEEDGSVKQKLLISTNKLSRIDCRGLNESSLNMLSDFAKETFVLTQIFIKYARDIDNAECQKILKDALMIIHLRKLEKGDNVLAAVEDMSDDAPEKVALKAKLRNCVTSITDIEKVDILRIAEDMRLWESVDLLEKHKAEITKENKSKVTCKPFFDKISEALKRANHDYKKLLKLLSSDSDLARIIKAGDFFFVEPPEDKPEGSEKDNHAEMNLLKYLIKEGAKGTFYFGITKLSCYGCAIDIEVINKLAELGLSIEVKGLRQEESIM